MATFPVPLQNLEFPGVLYPLSAEERFIPVEEYLSSAYHPDMDYVDGHLEERNLGEYEHGDLQGEFLAILRNHAQQWSIYAVPECRLQVRENRFRIPDVMVLDRAKGRPTKVVTTAPLLCIEILSPSDNFLRLQTRIDDYVRMGVPNVWVVNPTDLRTLVVEGGTQRWLEDRTLTVAGTRIAIDLNAMAARIAAE